MGSENGYRCPVCRAKFRATRECSRCGADLSSIMRIAAEAWICRKNAVRAVRALAFDKAKELAERSQTLQQTERGRRLLLLTSWLKSG
ncbi:MAG: hypothetical protein JRJ09_16450 [Deltaproteobacteria bacterium]|nr:hypothetical protein [Deltaproteobacteria bacterium]